MSQVLLYNTKLLNNVGAFMTVRKTLFDYHTPVLRDRTSCLIDAELYAYWAYCFRTSGTT